MRSFRDTRYVEFNFFVKSMVNKTYYNVITFDPIKSREHIYVLEGGVRRNYSLPTMAKLMYGTTPSKKKRKNLSSFLRTITSVKRKRNLPRNQFLFKSPFTRKPVTSKNVFNATTARKKRAVRVISNAYNSWKSRK